jgi:hypothetical protein
MCRPANITYAPIGFMNLAAIANWFSRFVVALQISN